MSAIASQIASVSMVCWTVWSGTDQGKNQSSASLAFVRGIHWWPFWERNPPVTIWWRHHEWLVRQIRMFERYLVTNRRRSLSKILLNSSPPGQNGRHFADDMQFQRRFHECFFLIANRSLFQRGHLTIRQHWFRERWQTITWTNADPVHRRIYAAESNVLFTGLSSLSHQTKPNVLYMGYAWRNIATHYTMGVDWPK